MFPESSFRIIHKPVNQGKGAALRDGFRQVSGDIVLVQDADLEYDPADYPKLLRPILEDKADVVYGSRFMGGEPHRVLYFWPHGRQSSVDLVQQHVHQPEPDGHGGLLQGLPQGPSSSAFTSSAIASASSRRSRPRSPGSARACASSKLGVAYYGRSYEEGKKITWKDGLKAVLTIIRFRFQD